MRLGFALPQVGAVAGPEAVSAIAQRAEALGYDSLSPPRQLVEGNHDFSDKIARGQAAEGFRGVIK
jgi:hypothetical protein